MSNLTLNIQLLWVHNISAALCSFSCSVMMDKLRRIAGPECKVSYFRIIKLLMIYPRKLFHNYLTEHLPVWTSVWKACGSFDCYPCFQTSAFNYFFLVLCVGCPSYFQSRAISIHDQMYFKFDSGWTKHCYNVYILYWLFEDII